MSPHQVVLVTLAAAAAFLLGAAVLYRAACRPRRGAATALGGTAPGTTGRDVCRDLANACVTGGFLALAVGALQFSADLANDRERDRQGRVDRLAQDQRDFQTRLLLTADLSGFAPTRKDERQLPTYLAAKTLNGARFDGLSLRGTSFRDAKLRGATFVGAHLRGVDLTHADLTAADLSRATLADVDLRNASLHSTRIADVRRWSRVKVDAGTCWPLAQVPAGARGHLLIMGRPAAGQPPAYGHQCGKPGTLVTPGGVVRVPITAPARPEPAIPGTE